MNPATDIRPAEYFGQMLNSSNEIDDAVAEGYSVFAIDDIGNKRLIASPGDGVIERPSCGPKRCSDSATTDLQQALNIILGGEV